MLTMPANMVTDHFDAPATPLSSNKFSHFGMKIFKILLCYARIFHFFDGFILHKLLGWSSGSVGLLFPSSPRVLLAWTLRYIITYTSTFWIHYYGGTHQIVCKSHKICDINRPNSPLASCCSLPRPSLCCTPRMPSWRKKCHIFNFGSTARCDENVFDEIEVMPNQLCIRFNLIGEKLPVKYPWHYVPEGLMAGLTVAGFLTLI